LTDVYRQVDVVVVPSLYEAWGLVVHEGLAYGLAVITSDQVGSADDLIDVGVNGLVVPARSPEALAEAMRRLAGWSPEQWEQVAVRSRELVANCSFERAADGFVRACAMALEHRRAS
jgi:glycosyltransferase involved in cell wall biosynthesis